MREPEGVETPPPGKSSERPWSKHREPDIRNVEAVGSSPFTSTRSSLSRNASARTGAWCDESHSRRLHDVLSKGNPCSVHRRDRLKRSGAATSVSVVRPSYHDPGAATAPCGPATAPPRIGAVPSAQTRHKLGRSRSISTCTQLRLLGAPRVGGSASSNVCRSSVRWLQQHSEGDTRHLAPHDDIGEGCNSEGDIRRLGLHDDIGKPSGEGHLGLCGCRAQESAQRQEGNTSRTGELHRELGSCPPLVQDRRASFRPGRWIQSGRHRIPGERLGLGHGVGRGRGHPGGHVCRHPIGCHRGVQHPLAIRRSTREQVVSREHPRRDKGDVRCHRRGDETDEFLGVRHPAP